MNLQQYAFLEYGFRGEIIIYMASVKNLKEIKTLRLFDTIHLPRRLRYLHRYFGKGTIGVCGKDQLEFFQQFFPPNTVVNHEPEGWFEFISHPLSQMNLSIDL